MTSLRPGGAPDPRAAAFLFDVPDGWLPFSDSELRRSSHAYGLRLWSGVVSETPPRRSEIVVLSTIGALTGDWTLPPNGWPGHYPELHPSGAPESATLGGEHAVLSRYAGEVTGTWGKDGWWNHSDSGDRERMSIVQVTAGHRGWLYKVLTPRHLAALSTVMHTWRWERT